MVPALHTTLASVTCAVVMWGDAIVTQVACRYIHVSTEVYSKSKNSKGYNRISGCLKPPQHLYKCDKIKDSFALVLQEVGKPLYNKCCTCDIGTALVEVKVELRVCGNSILPVLIKLESYKLKGNLSSIL